MSTALWAAAVAAIAGFVAVYVTLARPDNADPAAPKPPAAQAPAQPSAALPPGPGANPLSQGHMAGFVFKKEPEELPEIKFQDAAGKERTLADWRGRVVLLNLWATWCAPCRREMPALDRLQQELGSDRFEVVAISVDRTGIAGARKFLDEAKVQHLAVFADPALRASSMLRAVGMPTTLLLDPQGREIGRLIGPAEWDSEDAKRLIRAVVG